MDNMENEQVMTTQEQLTETAEEIDMNELFENVTSEDDPETEPEPQEEQQEEPEMTPEEARTQSIKDGLQALFEDGWTQDELLALSKDKTVREDIAAGKDIFRAAMAYERRQKTQTKAQPKKGVPTLRTQATDSTKRKSAISEMTDAQFAEMSKKAQAALIEGKRVSFD